MTDSQSPRSFIPPYILNRIIAHGSQPQRTAAMLTLNHVRSLLPNPGAPLRRETRAILAPSSKPGIAQRSVHDAQNKMLLPGVEVRVEGQPATGDPAVDEAY